MSTKEQDTRDTTIMIVLGIAVIVGVGLLAFKSGGWAGVALYIVALLAVCAAACI